MAAFIASLLVLGAMVAVLVLVARRRPPNTPLTWGEAFVAATYVFTLLFVAYGVVPHQWLTLAGNTFKWRSDKIGIPVGGIAIGSHHLFSKPYLLFPKGIPLPHGHFIITAQTIQDIVATALYGIFVGAQVYGWSWWQKRGKQAAGTEVETSAYGRPLIRPAGEG